MAVETIKVVKGNITKEILKKDLPQYIANGWKKIEDRPIPKTYERI